jgi:serine/threonine protein kinase
MQAETQATDRESGHARPHERIGDYRVVTELARGGMGKVYLARRCGQAGFERLFAIKVMNQQLSGDPSATLMLLDEAHIASRVHHPNVVSVLDIGRHEHGYYLVMDYVEGCSLQQLLARSPARRPPRLIVPVLIEALRGLHAVHGLCNADGEPYKVVHRDVSPHNLLLGIDGACRVTDFGIAKARERFTDTQSGVFKGKLSYVAPEQLGLGGKIDRRADVWAAGVTLYVALTGEFPFEGKSPVAIARSIASQPIARPSQVGLRPPAVLDEVVMRALSREPDQRYPDAQAFADALQSVAISEDMLGTPAEVAAWVEASCGAELAERRRALALHTRPDSGAFPSHRPRPAMPLGSVPPLAPAVSESSRSLRVRRSRRRSRLVPGLVMGAVAIVAGVVLGLRDRQPPPTEVAPEGDLALQTIELVLDPPAVPAAAAPRAAPVSLAPPVRVEAPRPIASPIERPAPGRALAAQPEPPAPSTPSEPQAPAPRVAPVPDIAEPRVSRNPYLHGR